MVSVLASPRSFGGVTKRSDQACLRLSFREGGSVVEEDLGKEEGTDGGDGAENEARGVLRQAVER